MKALTVRQPWADAIAQPSRSFIGPKRIENRTWQTHYRGLFLLHAGLSLDRDASIPRGADWPGARGAVIAVAEITGCHFSDNRCCAEWGHDGVWHWELGDAVLALRQPVPAVGRLGLWTPDDALVRAVGEQL